MSETLSRDVGAFIYRYRAHITIVWVLAAIALVAYSFSGSSYSYYTGGIGGTGGTGGNHIEHLQSVTSPTAHPEKPDTTVHTPSQSSQQEVIYVKECPTIPPTTPPEPPKVKPPPPHDVEMLMDLPLPDCDPLIKASNRTINLVSSYFVSSDPQRAFEVREAFMYSLSNPFIHKAYVLVEGQIDDWKIPEELMRKVHQIPVQGQPYLPDLFEVAEEYCRDNIAIIANADTHMVMSSTPYLHLLHKTAMLALSRRAFSLAGGAIFRPSSYCDRHHNQHSVCQDQCKHYVQSHDTFIYQPPMHTGILNAMHDWADVKPNSWGSETNLLAMITDHDKIPPHAQSQLQHRKDKSERYWNKHPRQDGVKPLVLNPCHSIHTVHYHYSSSRKDTAGVINPPAPLFHGAFPPFGGIDKMCQRDVGNCLDNWQSLWKQAEMCRAQIHEYQNM